MNKVAQDVKQRCRHNKTWLLTGGLNSWCYECGAIQENKVEPPNISIPITKWIEPVGKGKKNPWKKFEAGRGEIL